MLGPQQATERELDPEGALCAKQIRDPRERIPEGAAQAHTGSVTDAGILTRDSVARRLNRETFLLLGGTAALLMQVAHPLVAAGVGAHSDFRRSAMPVSSCGCR